MVIQTVSLSSVSDKCKHFRRNTPFPGPRHSAITGTFYFAAVTLDWTSPENPSLWRDALKTLFDPCPAGWRVPQSGDKASGKCPWGAFTLADATANTPWDVAAAGYHWHPETVHNSPVWYPAGGSRYDNSKLYVIGHSGYAWSASSGRHYLGMDPGTITPDRNSASDSYGFPVRCIRE